MPKAWSAGLLVLAACGHRDEAPAPAPVPVAVVAIDAAIPFDALPPSERASIAAPPRAEWACAFDVDEDQGIKERGHATFRYGTRTSCRLPLSLVAQGVWGCPESYLRVDESDGMQREHTFSYDEHDRIIEYSVQVRERFTWEGDRLAVTAREQWGDADVATYLDRGDATVAVDAKGQLQEVLELEDGRLSRYHEYVYGLEAATATVHWNGGKPDYVNTAVSGPIRGRVVRTFVYDCPPVADASAQ